MMEVSKELRQTKLAIENEFLNKPGVVGVDIGYKQVRGQSIGILAIRVLVENKQDVPEKERIPPRIGDHFTDVIQRKYELHHSASAPATDPDPQADTRMYDPLVGGISIGAYRLVGGKAFVGTLGAIVKDNVTGEPLLLSNFHVLSVDETGAAGDLIVQPGTPDGGVQAISVAGLLVRGSLGGEVDCALASAKRAVVGEVADIGRVTGVAKAALGQRVRKRGRTSGVTYGTVDTIDLTLKVDFGGKFGKVTLTNQINVMPDTTRNASFGAKGDSGSVLMTDDNKVVGLYMAGDDASGDAIANPIASVLSALNVGLIYNELPQTSYPPPPWMTGWSPPPWMTGWPPSPWMTGWPPSPWMTGWPPPPWMTGWPPPPWYIFGQ